MNNKNLEIPLLAPAQELSVEPSLVKSSLINFIKIYQCLLSPFIGTCCRFYPCCSSYTIEAINTHGCIKGCYLGSRRILRCHPYSSGGFDPVPDHHPSNQK